MSKNYSKIEKIGEQGLVAEEFKCYGLNVVCIYMLNQEPTFQRNN